MTLQDIAALMAPIGRSAVEAAQVLALATTEQKNAALAAAAAALRARAPEILAANAHDMKAGEAAGLSAAMLDRLRLDPARVEAMATGVEQIAALPHSHTGRFLAPLLGITPGEGARKAPAKPAKKKATTA